QNLLLMEMYVNPTLRVSGVDREQQVWTYRYAAAKPEAAAKPVSIKAKTQPRIVEDAIVSVVSAKGVRLSWKAPSASTDVTGYHVERARVEVFTEDQIVRLKKDTPPLAEPSVGSVKAMGKFVRLTKEPVKGLTFADTAIDLAKPQAVDGEPVFTHRFGKDQIDE